jgi:hypothetical protein
MYRQTNDAHLSSTRALGANLPAGLQDSERFMSQETVGKDSRLFLGLSLDGKKPAIGRRSVHVYIGQYGRVSSYLIGNDGSFLRK